MDDRVLAGLVERGQSREAVCAYLDAPENEVFDRCAALGLPAPASRPLRESRRPNAWQVADIRKLIDAWVRNHHVEYIASALSRSVSGVYGKARRLGLFRRKRSDLVRELPLFAWAEKQEPQEPPKPEPPRRPNRDEVDWRGNEALLIELSDRWFAGQHYKQIAREMNISEASIRSTATRIGLPARERYEIVASYDPEKAAANPKRKNLVQRKCRLTGVMFWGTRNGPHTSPGAMKSRRYTILQAGFSEYAMA